jgi:hypothetical protein
MSSKNSNNLLHRISDGIWGVLLSRFEKKLVRCHGYRDKSIAKWKRQTGLSWTTANKVLHKLEVFDSRRIRDLIRNVVENRSDIFTPGNFYITSFGPIGKSGGVVLYDFSHATKISRETIEPWQIAELPSGSRIIFVDDLVGTGRQSVDYIQKRLNPFLSSSHKPCLFSICATPAGIQHVRDNSVFDVLCAFELHEQEFNHYQETNRNFSQTEKNAFLKLNKKLGQNTFDQGLLVAFHHSTPNNTMPFIWKDGYRYENDAGEKKSWFALLPRSY